MGFYDYQVFSSWLNIVESWEIAFRRQAAMFGDDIVASWPQLLPIKCGPHDIRFAIVCSLSPSDFPPFGRKLERSMTRCFRQRAGAIKQISCLWKPTPFYSRCGFYPLVHCREDHLNVTQFTFMIISKCGFGFATSWTPPESGAMAFPEALRVVSETIVPRMVLPSWAYKLPVKRSAEDLCTSEVSHRPVFSLPVYAGSGMPGRLLHRSYRPRSIQGGTIRWTGPTWTMPAYQAISSTAS